MQPMSSRMPTYPVIVEALLIHKNPAHRFTIYPPDGPALGSPQPGVTYDQRILILDWSISGRITPLIIGWASRPRASWKKEMAGLPHPDVVAAKWEVQLVALGCLSSG